MKDLSQIRPEVRLFPDLCDICSPLPKHPAAKCPGNKYLHLFPIQDRSYEPDSVLQHKQVSFPGDALISAGSRIIRCGTGQNISLELVIPCKNYIWNIQRPVGIESMIFVLIVPFLILLKAF